MLVATLTVSAINTRYGGQGYATRVRIIQSLLRSAVTLIYALTPFFIPAQVLELLFLALNLVDEFLFRSSVSERGLEAIVDVM